MRFTYALLGIILFRGRFGFCGVSNNFNVGKQKVSFLKNFGNNIFSVFRVG